jgi:DNA (cytosine-5)-methyltransferase 1
MGYYQAGFDVVGVDIQPQPNYPFQFIQWDVFDWLHENGAPSIRLSFDAIHASPPCQGYSDLANQNKRTYPKLIEPVRAMLRTTGLPYVIENVETAPLVDPIILCGTMFRGLRVLRHRKFESNLRLVAPLHGHHPLVYTTDKRKGQYGKLDQDTAFVSVNGGGNCSVANKRAAMGIGWPMTGHEANEAIPPAYTAWVGRQLMSASQKLAS